MAKTEAFSRALIDAQLVEAGWKVTDVDYNIRPSNQVIRDALAKVKGGPKDP